MSKSIPGLRRAMAALFGQVARGRRSSDRRRSGLLTDEDDSDRVEENPGVERRGLMFDVVQVVLELFDLLLQSVGVPEPDLRPAGYPGPNHRAQRVVGD